MRRTRRHDAVVMVGGHDLPAPFEVRLTPDRDRLLVAPRGRARHRDGGADERRAARAVRQRLRARRGRPARADVHRLDRHPRALAGAPALRRRTARGSRSSRATATSAARCSITGCSSTWTCWIDEMARRRSRLVLVSPARIPLLQADADIGRYLTADERAAAETLTVPTVTLETGPRRHPRAARAQRVLRRARRQRHARRAPARRRAGGDAHPRPGRRRLRRHRPRVDAPRRLGHAARCRRRSSRCSARTCSSAPTAGPGSSPASTPAPPSRSSASRCSSRSASSRASRTGSSPCSGCSPSSGAG